MLRSYYQSSIFIESDQGRKVSGCSLFLFLLVLQSEISLAPRAIPWPLPQDTTSSDLHILHYNSFGLIKFKVILLDPESCNDLLSLWCKPSFGNKIPHKITVSLIRFTSANFRLPHYIKIKQLSHVHVRNPHLGIKTPQPRPWCKPSWGIKHHDLFSPSVHELVQYLFPHNIR